MKKLVSTAVALALCACATPQKAFESDPEDYGLYIATTNIYANSEFVVQQEGTGKVFSIRISHMAPGDSTGYIMASLPAGRYRLSLYSPDGTHSYPITTPNGWFDVQNDCFNFGGRYDFQMGEDGLPTYQNTSTLQDVASLPHHYRDLVSGHDVCQATMGRENDRFGYADVKQQLQLE